MKANEIITVFTQILIENGDIKVCLQGMDDGGCYPNDYRTTKIDLYEDEEGNTIFVDSGDETSTVTEVIDLLRGIDGETTVNISYGDSGGSYGGFTDCVDIFVKEIDGEPYAVIE